MTFTGKGIFNSCICFQHLHTQFSETVYDNGGMPQTHMYVLLMKAAVETPVLIVLNCPVFTLEFQETLRSHFGVTIDKKRSYVLVSSVLIMVWVCIKRGSCMNIENHQE